MLSGPSLIPVDFTFPDAARNAVDETGRVRVLFVSWNILRAPSQLAALVRLGGYSRRAHLTLSAATQSYLPSILNTLLEN